MIFLKQHLNSYILAGRKSEAAFIGMQAMCKETLEKLYNYAGVIIEDRQNLKAELRDKKCLMEEMMLHFMEEIITHVLKVFHCFINVVLHLCTQKRDVKVIIRKY